MLATFDQWPGTHPVTDTSCASFLQAADAYLASINYPGVHATTCSSPTMSVGSSVNFSDAGFITVTALTGAAATPPPPTDTAISCGAACTVTVKHEFSSPPLQLEPGQGAQVALAVIAVWVVGWSIRMVIRAMSSGDSHSVQSED